MKTRKRPYTMTRRAEKAAATRARILDRAVQIYSDRSIDEFTLDEIARRAETTVQTVLRAYASKENLLLAALHRLAEAGASLKPTPPGDVAAAVAAIFDLYETFGDMLMQRLADERRHPAMKPALDLGRGNHRVWVEDIFAPSLKGRSRPERGEILDGITVATDIYAWEKLRRDMNKSRAAAEAVVCRMVTSLIQREDNDGKDPVAELVGRRQPAS
jgi:AcrR family transcriptional regulator